LIATTALRGLPAVGVALLLGAAPSVAADQWALEQQSVTQGGANYPSASDLQGGGITRNGRHVFFRTAEALVPEDHNGFLDLYDRHDGITELISVGPSGNGYDGQEGVRAVTPDGTRVVFSTSTQLTPEANSGLMLYQRYQGTTTLVGDAGTVVGASEDASIVYFRTTAQVVPEDTDTESDLYSWDGNSASLVSAPGSPVQTVFPDGFSRDGTRIYFRTGAQLDPADNDPNCPDLYVYSGGVASLISGPVFTTRVCQNENVAYNAESEDGDHVFFTTAKWLDPNGDDSLHPWEHANNQNQRLVSNYGQTKFVAAGDDGSRVYFTTTAQLVPEDTNAVADAYERENGQYRLIPGTINGVSRDGSRVFFQTSAQLVPEDQDTTPDIYVRDGSYTELITSDVSWDSRGFSFIGGSDDGSRVFFSAITPPSNGPRCLWSHPIYGHASTNTGLCAPNSQGPFWLIAANGERAVLGTPSSLLPSDTDSAYDVYAASLVEPAGYPRPKGASPIRLSLVPAYSACTAPNRSHGSPLSFPSCNPPETASQNLTIGIGDGTPPAAKSVGSLKAVVHPGAAGPPNDSDVALTLGIGNVYKRSDLTDYTGELQGRLTVRLTDKQAAGAATTADFPFSFTVPCSATSDTTLGASCAVDTTSNAVMPGSVVDGERAIWALDQVRVYDGGPDGDVDTPGNSLFEVQGLFVP
jgi:hypothetical protein